LNLLRTEVDCSGASVVAALRPIAVSVPLTETPDSKVSHIKLIPALRAFGYKKPVMPMVSHDVYGRFCMTCEVVDLTTDSLDRVGLLSCAQHWMVAALVISIAVSAALTAMP
jgi:hypothetical protein